MTSSERSNVPAVGTIRFYTRPGCGISAGLDRRLRRLGLPLEYHDIWADPAAAAFVRSVARGNETVPTLVVGDLVLVAPSARQVTAAAQEHAPHLLPPSPPGAPRRRWRPVFLRRAAPRQPGA